MSLDKARRELYYWQVNSKPTNFSALLYVLIQKADISNRSKLASVYPEYMRTYNDWLIAKDPEVLFKEWGF